MIVLLHVLLLFARCAALLQSVDAPQCGSHQSSCESCFRVTQNSVTLVRKASRYSSIEVAACHLPNVRHSLCTFLIKIDGANTHYSVVMTLRESKLSPESSCDWTTEVQHTRGSVWLRLKPHLKLKIRTQMGDIGVRCAAPCGCLPGPAPGGKTQKGPAQPVDLTTGEGEGQKRVTNCTSVTYCNGAECEPQSNLNSTHFEFESNHYFFY